MKKFLQKKVYKAIPIWGVLLFVGATGALAVWLLNNLISTGSFFSTQGTNFKFALEEIGPWTDEPPALFEVEEMVAGVPVSSTFWLQYTTETPPIATSVQIVATETDQNGDPLVGTSLLPYLIITGADWRGSFDMLGGGGIYIGDKDADGLVTMADLVLAGNIMPNDASIDPEDYAFEITLDPAVEDVAELNGASVSFDTTFEAVPLE